MQRIAYIFFYITVFLIAIGVVMIYSTSAILAQERYGEATFFLKRELLWVSFGMIALYIGYRTPYRFWARASLWFVFLAAALLILVLIPSIGHEVGGARRWIKLGSFGLQPSEIAKYAVIIFLAQWLANHQDEIKSFVKGFLPPMLILGFFVGMILIQPDLGTSFALGIIGLILLFVGGVRVRY